MGLREKEETKLKSIATSSIPEETRAKSLLEGYDKDSMELDVIERLKSNIAMLDDLQKRLKFMNNELESVLGAKKS